HRQARGRRPHLRRREGAFDAAAPGARGAWVAREGKGCERGEKRPSRRRARRRDSGLSEIGGAEIDQRGEGPAGQEGRLLYRGDREERPRGGGSHQGDRARGREELPVAEIDALGIERAKLGAAAAL